MKMEMKNEFRPDERGILGRKLACETTREELNQAVGTGPRAFAPTYPPESDKI